MPWSLPDLMESCELDIDMCESWNATLECELLAPQA